MIFLILTCMAYLAGSVNVSIVLFKLLGREDPRRLYSRNPGVTNVFRQAGPLWALLVLLVEIAKAAGIALAADAWLPAPHQTWIGLALLIGNRYPCFHLFKGGKGVANYLGFTAVFSPVGTAVAMGVYAAALGVFRIPFVASFFMVAVLAGSTALAFDFQPLALSATVITVACILYWHQSNIRELRGSGTGSAG